MGNYPAEADQYTQNKTLRSLLLVKVNLSENQSTSGTGQKSTVNLLSFLLWNSNWFVAFANIVNFWETSWRIQRGASCFNNSCKQKRNIQSLLVTMVIWIRFSLLNVQFFVCYYFPTSYILARESLVLLF